MAQSRHNELSISVLSTCQMLLTMRTWNRNSKALITINHLRASGNYTTCFRSVSNSSFCTYGFHTILNVNRDYSLKQQQQTDLCNGEVWFLWGMDRILKHDLDNVTVYLWSCTSAHGWWKSINVTMWVKYNERPQRHMISDTPTVNLSCSLHQCSSTRPHAEQSDYFHLECQHFNVSL